MRALVILSLFFGLCLSCSAEFRVWKDRKGNEIEAELITISSTQVVIRGREGKVFKFSSSKLSDEDQTYLKTELPPLIDIKFSKKLNRNKARSTVTIIGKMVVTKKEQRSYDKSLKAVLMIIGESHRDHDCIIVDRIEAAFDFKDSIEFSLTGNSFDLVEPSHYISQMDGKKHKYGVAYKDYLVVILDDKAKVVAAKSSLKNFENEFAELLKYKAKDRFTTDLKKSQRSGTITEDGAYGN